MGAQNVQYKTNKNVIPYYCFHKIGFLLYHFHQSDFIIELLTSSVLFCLDKAQKTHFERKSSGIFEMIIMLCGIPACLLI